MSAAQKSSGAGARSRREDPAGHVRMSVAERREFQRNRVVLQAKLKINGESFSAELLDISTGGAQLRCSVVPGAGAVIGVELDGFGVLPARVVRRLPKTVAVEFDLAKKQRDEFVERLNALLKARV